MFDAIRRLFGGGDRAAGAVGGPAEAPAATDGVEYKGYRIVPQALRQGNGFLTAGLIILDGGEAGRREHRFVRADTHTTADEARQFTILKAERLIDEQGERLFGG